MAIFNVGNRIIEPGTWPWGYAESKITTRTYYDSEPLVEGTNTPYAYANYSSEDQGILFRASRDRAPAMFRYHGIHTEKNFPCHISFVLENIDYWFNDYGYSAYIGLGTTSVVDVGLIVNYSTRTTSSGVALKLFICDPDDNAAQVISDTFYALEKGEKCLVEIDVTQSEATLVIKSVETLESLFQDSVPHSFRSESYDFFCYSSPYPFGEQTIPAQWFKGLLTELAIGSR
jgi:hypothetical protein